MKRTVCMLLAALMLLALAACGSAGKGKQTACAYLDQDGTCVTVTVDLSSGWSVEFVRGAAYLYDGVIAQGKEGVAMLITLDKEVYEEDLAKAMADKDRKEADGGVYYTDETGRGAYLTSLNGSAYVLITSANRKDIEAVAARFTLTLQWRVAVVESTPVAAASAGVTQVKSGVVKS